jgi:hypothetical protein
MVSKTTINQVLNKIDTKGCLAFPMQLFESVVL